MMSKGFTPGHNLLRASQLVLTKIGQRTATDSSWQPLIIPLILIMSLLVACQPIQPVAQQPAAAAAAATVTVAQNDAFGSFLVDSQGMTLYLFLNDEPGVTNCYDQCAGNWPPLLVAGDPVAGVGVDAALLGTTERTDGAIQVTYNGWPLYYYAQDVNPGDTVGQERGDVWYVVSPAGEQIP